MTINLIDKEAILKKLTKNQEKQLLKPWVTKRIKIHELRKDKNT